MRQVLLEHKDPKVVKDHHHKDQQVQLVHKELRELHQQVLRVQLEHKGPKVAKDHHQ